MSALLLPLSALREHRACFLRERIKVFTEHHGVEPGETTTLREWLEVTPAMVEVLWATRCLGREGRILGLEVGTRAAWRALAAVGEQLARGLRATAAVAAAEAVLVGWWAGQPTDTLRLSACAASMAVRYPPGSGPRTAHAAEAVADAAACGDPDAYADWLVEAAFRVKEVFDQASAARVVPHSAWRQEVFAERADFMAVLERLEQANQGNIPGLLRLAGRAP